jgi:hypothetical protein
MTLVSNVLFWAGGAPANMLLAAAHFTSAAYIAQSLEVTDTNRFLLERRVGYTQWGMVEQGSATIPVKWLIVAFLAITGTFHLLYALLGRRAASLRFIEYSITASIMFIIIALLSGEDNADVMFACAALIASTMFFGFVQDERLRYTGVGTSAFILGWAPFAAAWFLLIKRFFSTLAAAAEVPAFVKSIVWVELALFSSFAFVQWWWLVRRGAEAVGANSPVAGPRGVRVLQEYGGGYNVLSVTAKLFLAFTAYFGLKAIK